MNFRGGLLPPLKSKQQMEQIKILPREFENALNSNDKSVAEAYKKLREKDFPGWITMGELEEEHRLNKKRWTKKELLEIFPEAVSYLEEARKDCLIKNEALEMIIRNELKIIEKIDDAFFRWLSEEWLEETDGKILNKYEKKLKEINLYLDPSPAKEGRITSEDIEKAKEYPFEDLIETNRAGFALCPFHEEKTPSFYIKKNFGYCFGCGRCVDTIQFLMETENIGFTEAVKRLI
jgi:ferredoxin